MQIRQWPYDPQVRPWALPLRSWLCSDTIAMINLSLRISLAGTLRS